MNEEITCPICTKRANGFLTKATHAKECIEWPNKEGVIIARNTIGRTSKEWRQTRNQGVCIWRKEHLLKPDAFDGHIIIRNLDNQKSSPIRLCEAIKHITLIGPGAQQHASDDLMTISLYQFAQNKTLQEKLNKDSKAKARRALIRKLRKLGVAAQQTKSPDFVLVEVESARLLLARIETIERYKEEYAAISSA
jgi:hypothetical protein